MSGRGGGEGRSPRVVAIGDLNAASDALTEILEGTGLVDRDHRWIGGDQVLVQTGDIFNRGDNARRSFEILLGLRPQARAAGGDVIVLLGNHEVMTALGNEAYCTVGEYLSFATLAEQAAWRTRVRRAFLRIYSEHAGDGPIPPFQPRLDAWMHDNVPGKAALRRALGPRGHIGRVLRRLPVAARVGDVVFVHAGLHPEWAERGIAELNRTAGSAWEGAGFYGALPRSSILRALDGPLHWRGFTLGDEAEGQSLLDRSLELLDARRMVVGHTRVQNIAGGEPGRIAMRFGGRLACIDIGLAQGAGLPRAALVIDAEGGHEWRPEGSRSLWHDEGQEASALRRVV